MPNLKDLILYALIIAGVIVLFLNQNQGNEDNVTVELKYDSIPRQINNSTISNPITVKPGAVNIPPAQLTILQSTDTALLKSVLKEILNRYYEVRTQEITSADDSISITAVNTITENRITNSKLSYRIKFPVSHITNNPPVRNKVFAGIYLEAGANGLYSVAPQVAFENKRGMLLSLNYNAYNLATGTDKYSFGVGVAQKISFRKN